MLDYVALGILIFVGIVLFYGVIVIHDIPYEIAVHRKHPQQDAILVAGWVSLFTLHVIWPFLWIWATLYREDRGWGFSTAETAQSPRLQALEQQVGELQQRLDALTSSAVPSVVEVPAAPAAPAAPTPQQEG